MNKKLSQYGKSDASTNMETNQTPPVTGESLYRSIQQLPLRSFIDCLVDQNLHSLIIPGSTHTPDEITLQTTWNKLLQEYSDAVGNHEYRLYISLYREISALQLTYDLIGNTVGILQITYSEYLCDELNKLLRTKFTFNHKDQATYQEELRKCLRRRGGIKLTLDLKKLQFEEIEKKQQSGKTESMDRKYFTSVLVKLSDHAGYHLSDNITVGEYAERIKTWNLIAQTPKPAKR